MKVNIWELAVDSFAEFICKELNQAVNDIEFVVFSLEMVCIKQLQVMG